MSPNSKNIAWVVAEHDDGRLKPVTYEVIAFASEAARKFGIELRVVVIGHPAEPVAGEIASVSGSDVLGIDAPSASGYKAESYRFLLKKALDSQNPEYIFIPHTTTGWDYAPALAVDVKASCITAVNGVKDEDGPVFTRQICNGKLCEDVRPLPGRPAIITVMPGASKPSGDAVKPGGVEIIEMETPLSRIKTLEYVETQPKSMDLEKAEAIIAAGRGIGEPENLDPIRELASLFERGAVGASRPLVDNGYLPLDAQVGMTGRTVSPKLYLACGISGAVQHTMGMRGADLIVAVNRDKNALFCKLAHYCIIEDMHKFLPVFIEKIRVFKKGPEL